MYIMNAEEVGHTYMHITSELIFYNNTETIIDGIYRMWLIKYHIMYLELLPVSYKH